MTSFGIGTQNDFPYDGTNTASNPPGTVRESFNLESNINSHTLQNMRDIDQLKGKISNVISKNKRNYSNIFGTGGVITGNDFESG